MTEGPVCDGCGDDLAADGYPKCLECLEAAPPRRLVLVESPYAGDVEANVAFAREALRDCLLRGEAPFASHLLYTQMLDDHVPAERELGIAAGLAVGARFDATVVYLDRGVSGGMRHGIAAAEAVGRPVEYRYLRRPLIV